MATVANDWRSGNIDLRDKFLTEIVYQLSGNESRDNKFLETVREVADRHKGYVDTATGDSVYQLVVDVYTESEEDAEQFDSNVSRALRPFDDRVLGNILHVKP